MVHTKPCSHHWHLGICPTVTPGVVHTTLHLLYICILYVCMFLLSVVCLSESDHESSTLRRPWPTKVVALWKKKKYVMYSIDPEFSQGDNGMWNMSYKYIKKNTKYALQTVINSFIFSIHFVRSTLYSQ
jgi:hypothetical protein